MQQCTRPGTPSRWSQEGSPRTWTTAWPPSECRDILAQEGRQPQLGEPTEGQDGPGQDLHRIATAAQGAEDPGLVWIPPEHPKGDQATEEELRIWRQERNEAIGVEIKHSQGLPAASWPSFA